MNSFFALIAPYLSLGEVCRLRASCHRLLRCSAVLAGGCLPQTRRFERNGKCVPDAVLAWAVGRRHMGVQLKNEVRSKEVALGEFEKEEQAAERKEEWNARWRTEREERGIERDS